VADVLTSTVHAPAAVVWYRITACVLVAATLGAVVDAQTGDQNKGDKTESMSFRFILIFPN
jgi:hypothetical protein